MALTRFKDARSGKDGPVSGALQCISVGFDDVANSETVSRRVEMPAGAAFEITDIKVSADSVTGDPALTIGDTAAGTQIVATVSVTTDLGALTIKDGVIDAGEFADVVLVADSGDVAESVSVSIWGYVTKPPTSVLQSDRGGAAGY
jgi:hypothetical protein